MQLMRALPPAIRLFIRHIPPRRRGLTLANLWTQLSPPTAHIYVSKEPSGIRLRCDLRDALSRVVYYRGTVDRPLERWLTNWLRADDFYVDVGANIGFFVSLAAERVGKKGRIVAFEPYPPTFNKLKEAVHETGKTNIHVRSEAVGESAGVAEILAPAGQWVHQSYRASVVPTNGLGEGTTVTTISLDDLLRELSSRIRLLKIDVEGNERFVLRGARQLLSQRLCDAVLIELNRETLALTDATVDDLVADMRDLGYEPFRVDKDGDLTRWPRPEVEGVYADAIFLPKELPTRPVNEHAD